MRTILDTKELIQLYKKGYFPMAKSANSVEIHFFKPQKRFIIPIYSFHLPRKLFSEYKKNKFTFCINTQFETVIQNCSIPRKINNETWINETIKETYLQLNLEGQAHSIECFYKNKLVAGLYGVHIGSCFFGESMFNNMTNTSKLTLLYLIALLANNKFTLLDSQFYNPHLLQFGAYEINDDEYQQYLHKGINKKISFPQELNFQKSVSILQSLSQRS